MGLVKKTAEEDAAPKDGEEGAETKDEAPPAGGTSEGDGQ